MTQQALGSTFNFFFAEVRDIRDPDKAGKVKVMVHGHHNISKVAIPDSDLPWAHPIMNNTPSLNKIGTSVNYLPGTCVVGFWLDPETKQIPCILGSMHRSGFTTAAVTKDPETDGSNDGNKSTPGVGNNPGNMKANQKNQEQYALFKDDTEWNSNKYLNNNGLT